MKKLENWITEHISPAEIKAVVGIRGIGKTKVLMMHFGRKALCLDFREPACRQLKVADDVLDYLETHKKHAGVMPLILVDPSRIGGHTRLIKTLFESGKWNIFFVASNCHILEQAASCWKDNPIVVYRAWGTLNKSYSRERMFHRWDAIFLRDVADGMNSADVRGIREAVEFYSDHISEVMSDRKVSRGIAVSGNRRSAPSIAQYRKALENSYIIEFCEGYDCFNKMILKNSSKVFWTDLSLRAFRFGASPENEAKRVALNELYIKLRHDYEKVYWPKDCRQYAFLTFEANGEQKLWECPFVDDDFMSDFS